MRPVFGIESEYAAVGRGDALLPPDHLLAFAAERLVHLPGMHAQDLYLANGSRFYLDSGGHPEMCTPECSDPLVLVHYLRAGERIVAGLLDEIHRRHGRSVLDLFRCNVDYGAARATWGSHESYRYTSSPQTLFPGLVPHLVSRLIYTGAGGFDPFTSGLRFTLSPRALHLCGDVVPQMTRVRGLIHNKDEGLAVAGSHRLHLLCGESLCSDLGTYLRVGTTALIAAVLDVRPELLPQFTLADTLEALDLVADRRHWREPLALRTGAPMTAVQIQQRLCEAVAGARTRLALPSWCAALCDTWWGVLTDLEDEPLRLQTKLDWPMKCAIYDEWLGERGLEEPRIEMMTSVLDQLTGALVEHGFRGPVELSDLEFGRCRDGNLIEALRPIERRLQDCGVGWADLEAFIAVRNELWELDLRFGQLGADGLFERLDGAGLLSHRLVGDADVERAMVEPPADGRAHLRGRMIADLRSRHGMEASWEYLRDRRRQRTFVMEDPAEARGFWRAEKQERADFRELFARLCSGEA